MKPVQRFHVIVVTLTAVVIFIMAAILKPAVERFASSNYVMAVVAKALSTVGVYTLIAKGLSVGLLQIEWFRKFVYGRAYLHGTWVGYFVGRSGSKRWMVETYIQTLDDLRINGRSFDSAGALHATWKVLATRVDTADGTMTFAYEMDILTRLEPVRGITTVQFDYDPKTGRPMALSGIAQDLGPAVRISVHEYKWKDAIESFESAFVEARQRYP